TRAPLGGDVDSAWPTVAPPSPLTTTMTATAARCRRHVRIISMPALWAPLAVDDDVAELARSRIHDDFAAIAHPALMDRTPTRHGFARVPDARHELAVESALA